MINVTESCANRIKQLIAEEDDPNLKLRVFVQGGGCSGFQYGFTLDEDKNDDDFEVPMGLSSVLIDSMSMQYVEGAEIDYTEDLSGANFSIKNPHAISTCGCGSSFNV